MEDNIGERIKRERKANGLTQGDLAKPAGVSKAAVSQWELGSSKSLKPDNLLACADTLGVEMRWLITGKGSKSKGSEPVADQSLNSDAVEFALAAMRQHLSAASREAGSVELESRLFDRLYRLYLLGLEDQEKIDPASNEIKRLVKINQNPANKP